MAGLVTTSWWATEGHRDEDSRASVSEPAHSTMTSVSAAETVSVLTFVCTMSMYGAPVTVECVVEFDPPMMFVEGVE